MFKKDVIKGIAFDKRFFVGEDTLFFACCERKARKIYFVHDVLYHYVVYKESACHGSFNLKKCTLIYAWDEICKLYKNSHEENMLIISLNMKIMEFCFAHYSDPAFLESGCLGELITKYRDTQRVYFEELMKTRQYWELLKGIVFGICPKLYLKLREKKKQLLLSK